MSIKMIFASAAALAMVAGTPAFAAKGSGQQSAAEAGGGYKAKGERKKCRTFENSAMRSKRERLCLTAAEWKKFNESR